MPLRPARDTLVGEEDMTGTVREYLYAGGEAPTAMRSRNSDGSYSNFFFVTNTHGDVVAVTDKDGNVVNRYAYGPWGEATRVSEQVHQPFRYAGYRYEDGFDLYYLRARWMDPGTGRFLSRDPMAAALQNLVAMNKYIYAHNSPASKTDPSGYGPRSSRVIVWFHGTDADQNSKDAWERFFRELFPGTDFMKLGYSISWGDTIFGGEEGQVRQASEQMRGDVGGRVVYAAGHSEGGDILFRAVSRSGYFAAAVATMGVPVSFISGNEWAHVGYWLDLCSHYDPVCNGVDAALGRRHGPDERHMVSNPGVYTHSGYINDEVAEHIKRVFGQRGAK